MQNFSRSWSTCYSPRGLYEIEIQVLLRKGLPRFDIIGLPQNMIREGKDRILASLYQLGVELPSQKILVHLNPGDLAKEGSHLDLPILYGILQVLGLCRVSENKDYLWGELQLDGKIRSPDNLLAHLLFAEQKPSHRLMTSRLDQLSPQLREFLYPSLVNIDTASDLFRTSEKTFEKKYIAPEKTQSRIHELWIAESKENSVWNSLQGSPEQFLFWSLVSLGRWNCLVSGSPGVGKSTWCLALDELQRPLAPFHWSTKFQYQSRPTAFQSSILEIAKPPFEIPHHTSSAQAIVGGGSVQISPGAISRAHHGILFLDELPEFHRDVIEALREPLETGHLSIARRGQVHQFPAQIQLLAAMNPCKCGGGQRFKCKCSSAEFWAYQARVSEAFRDRFHHQILWNYRNEKSPVQFSLTEVRHRLLEAERAPCPKIKSFDLSFIPSPRRQRLWLQMLESWARWFGQTEIHYQDSQNLKNFLNQLEDEHANSDIPRISSGA